MTDNTAVESQEIFEAPKQSKTAFQQFIANIPYRKIQRLGKSLGWLIYALDIRHRRIVRRNLKFAFPDWPWDRVLDVTRGVFENFGLAIFEIIQLSCLSNEKLLMRVRIEGKENLKYLLSPKGTIIISGHLGNWELALLFAASYFGDRLLAIARKIDFAPLDRWVYNFRTRFGGEVINKTGALPDMTKSLRGGNVLATLIDQGTKPGEGIDAMFFNRKVLATPGIAMLAMRTKVTVIPAFCVRNPQGFTVILNPPVTMQKTKNLRADIQVNTQRIMDTIEAAVRKYPEQYFWFHKRWKIYHSHLYREDLERKQRQRERQRRKSGAQP
jgi:KDO2-lipid IV(A) lauroyltransferase